MSKFQHNGHQSSFFPSFSGPQILDFSRPLIPSDDSTNQSRLPRSISDPDSQEVPDYYEACLGYIRDILMEEDLDSDCIPVPDHGALEATEKSFYDALGQVYNPPLSNFSDQYSLLDSPSTDNAVPHSFSNDNESGGSYGCVDSFAVESSCWSNHPNQFQLASFHYLGGEVDDGSLYQPDSRSVGCSAEELFTECAIHSKVSSEPSSSSSSVVERKEDSKITNVMMNQTTPSRRIHQRDEITDSDSHERSNKQAASYSEEYMEMEKYDGILLPREDKQDSTTTASSNGAGNSEKLKSKSRRNRGTKKRNNGGSSTTVDLRTLLTHCAQAVSTFDLTTANEQLKKIREHSDPCGNSSLQRVSHYFANALEARINGTGSRLYTDIINSPTPASGVLKAYECYVTATPLMRISFFLANRMIAKLAEKTTKTTIHVIDFGIFHGYQWPSLIQQLSEIPITGPPRLKITGIEYPEHGFRPAQKVEATGKRLAEYCKRFNVPFEYHAVAKKWELIRPEDIKTEEGEVIVVNCQFRSTNLLDETTSVDCPRDGFLRLIRSLKPDLFVHGIVNGTFSAPFFITRFREALFHFISNFDMFEATMSMESEGRRMIEENLHGKQILNVVASEGVERIERPESYKQWQVRTLRSGFRPRRLDRGVVDRVKAIVKKNYHKDFVVDEDGNWLLHGWKGRILFAISCWRPD